VPFPSSCVALGWYGFGFELIGYFRVFVRCLPPLFWAGLKETRFFRLGYVLVSQHFALCPLNKCGFFSKKVAQKFGGGINLSTFAFPFSRGRSQKCWSVRFRCGNAARRSEGCSRGDRKKNEKNSKKIWRQRKVLYFCIPD